MRRSKTIVFLWYGAPAGRSSLAAMKRIFLAFFCCCCQIIYLNYLLKLFQLFCINVSFCQGSQLKQVGGSVAAHLVLPVLVPGEKWHEQQGNGEHR